MEGGEKVRSSGSLAHISQEGSSKGAGKCGSVKADGVVKYESSSWSCRAEDGAVIVEDARVVWSKSVFATATESIGLTVEVSGTMENAEVEL
jgi:hypothetical protein